jgi:hypothetical protein
MRRSLVAVVAIALTFVGPAPIEAVEGTHCNFEFIVTLDPGLTTSPSSGTHGGTGGLTCDGLVNGQQPTGAGTLTDNGKYGTKDGDTCQMGGEGDGTDTLKIPTAAGLELVLSDFTFTFGNRLPTHGGLAAGEFKGSRFTGWFEFTPTEGDCISSPVTKARVIGEGTIYR